MGVGGRVLEEKSKNKNRRRVESNKNDTGNANGAWDSLLTVWPRPTVLLFIIQIL